MFPVPSSPTSKRRMHSRSAVERTGLIAEPAFMEEAVFLFVEARVKREGRTAFEWFYRARDKIYESTPPLRDKRFEDFYRQAFSRLGLGQLIEAAAEEFPLLKNPKLRWMVKRVSLERQEGSELYVSERHKTVLVCIQPFRITDLEHLKVWLRHELMHISDVLDPAFAYNAKADLGGLTDIENDLIRDRFRLLWDLYITARFLRSGKRTLFPLEKYRHDLARCTPSWNEQDRSFTFHDVSGKEFITHADLIAWARYPEGRSGQQAVNRCPFCQFPTFDLVHTFGSEDSPVIQKVYKGHPDWSPAIGICRQCLDLFRADCTAAL